MAKIQLNGKKVVIKSKISIIDLLKKYKLINKKIAVEHNGVIIPKISYKKRYLKNNDKLKRFLERKGLNDIKNINRVIDDILEDREGMEKDGVMTFENFQIFESDF